jgi:hypothetical protein
MTDRACQGNEHELGQIVTAVATAQAACSGSSPDIGTFETKQAKARNDRKDKGANRCASYFES